MHFFCLFACLFSDFINKTVEVNIFIPRGKYILFLKVVCYLHTKFRKRKVQILESSPVRSPITAFVCIIIYRNENQRIFVTSWSQKGVWLFSLLFLLVFIFIHPSAPAQLAFLSELISEIKSMWSRYIYQIISLDKFKYLAKFHGSELTAKPLFRKLNCRLFP